MKKIIILSTETVHHTYFINRLLNEGFQIEAVVYETFTVKPPFKNGPLCNELQEEFERENFFIQLSKEIPVSLPTHYVETVNTEETKKIITSYQADLGIVFGCGKIKPHVIKTTNDGLVNIHRGIAEEYRGLDSNLWAIYHKDYNNIGVTVHMVDEMLDTGDLLKVQRLKTRGGMQTYQLRYYTTVLATDVIIEVLHEYEERGRLGKTPQQKKGRYYSFMPLDLKIIVQERFDKYTKT